MKQCSYISLYISPLTEKRDLDNKNNKIYGYYANDIRLYLDDNIGKLSYVFQNTLNSEQKKKCHRKFFFRCCEIFLFKKKICVMFYSFINISCTFLAEKCISDFKKKNHRKVSQTGIWDILSSESNSNPLIFSPLYFS